MPGFSIARARDDTPGCREIAHFNNAGAALMPQVVVDTMVEHLRREAAIGGYEAAEEAGVRLEACRDSVAVLLGANPDEVAFVDSATRALVTGLWSLPLAAGDRILVSRVCYGSNALALLELQRRVGVQLVVVPSTGDGTIDLDALDLELRRGAAVVVLTHIPTNSGLVQPAAEVGRRCRQAGTIFLLDACQSVGQMVVDVADLGCDLLAATSRKYLRGPRGQGFLYVSRGLLPRLRPPAPDVGGATWTAPSRFTLCGDARRFECWEHSAAGRLGLGAAVDYAMGWGLAAIASRVTQLAAALRDALSQIPGIALQDPPGARCGIVTFTVAGEHPQETKARLAQVGVHVSVSGAASTLLDMGDRGLEAVVRASVHYYNDAADVTRLLQGLRAPEPARP